MKQYNQVFDLLKMFSVFFQRKVQNRFSKKASFWSVDTYDANDNLLQSTSVKRIVDIFRKNEDQHVIKHLKKLQRILMNGNKDYTFIDKYFTKDGSELDTTCYKIMNALNLPKEAIVNKDGNVLFVEIPTGVKWDACPWVYFNNATLFNKYKIYITVNGTVQLKFYHMISSYYHPSQKINKFLEMIAPNVKKMVIFTNLFKYDNQSNFAKSDYTLDLSRFFIDELIVKDTLPYRNYQYIKPNFIFMDKPKSILYYHKRNEERAYKQVSQL